MIYQVSGETLRENSELSPQRKPLDKAQEMFFKAFYEGQRDKTKIHSKWRPTQVSYCAEVGPLGGRELAARYVNEGEKHVQERRKVDLEILKQICTEFEQPLFETLLKDC